MALRRRRSSMSAHAFSLEQSKRERKRVAKTQDTRVFQLFFKVKRFFVPLVLLSASASASAYA